MPELKRIQKLHHIPAGGYVCRIEYEEIDNFYTEELGFHFDIREGEYSGYFTDFAFDYEYHDCTRLYPFFFLSYNSEDLLDFTDFVIAIEQSNPGFIFDGENEQDFQGKWIGLILREEEYLHNDRIKTTLKVVDFTSVDNIRNGNYRTYDIKRLQ